MIPEKYKAILFQPHHQSETRPKMDKVDRAAQFSPFSALVGYDEIIDETNRRTEDQIVWSEDANEELDRKLNLLEANISSHPEITVTYFVPDERKKGGKYVTVQKKVKRIDYAMRKICFTDRTDVDIKDVIDFSEKE